MLAMQLNKLGASVALILALTATLCAGTVSAQEGKTKVMAQAGQVVRLEVEPQAGRNTILVVNPTDQMATVDLVALDFEATEAGRETLELNPGDEKAIYLAKAFPTLALNKVGVVQIQVSTHEVTDFVMYAKALTVTFYSQVDPRWSQNRLGTCTGSTIGAKGCAITAITMAATHVLPNATPATMNTYLTNNSGYANGCDVYWAKAASICTMRLLACGLSAATNLTPDSISAAMKARFRDRRSSLAITNLALDRRAWAIAAASFGRSAFLPDSISVYSVVMATPEALAYASTAVL